MDLRYDPNNQPNITPHPSEALFAMHLVVFLSFRCRVATPIVVAPPESLETGSVALSEQILTGGYGADADDALPGRGRMEDSGGDGEHGEDGGRGERQGAHEGARPTENVDHGGDTSFDTNRASTTLIGSGSPYPHSSQKVHRTYPHRKAALTDILEGVDKDDGRIDRWVRSVSEVASEHFEA